MFKKNKGQVAVEFIILLALLLLFFHSMLLPSIEFAEEVVSDTFILVKTQESMTRLANNLESFSTTVGEGKRQIFIYLPGDAIINGCSDEGPPQLDATVTVSPRNAIARGCNLETGVCNLKVPFYTGLDVDCGTIPTGYRGYITIEKEEGEISFYVS